MCITKIPELQHSVEHNKNNVFRSTETIIYHAEIHVDWLYLNIMSNKTHSTVYYNHFYLIYSYHNNLYLR